MNSKLEQKLKTLPKAPGVYFHKNKNGEIIYVGKAAVLNSRVRQYFQKSRIRDPKTDALVAEIFDTDWVVVETELDALFLEAEMIRRYMPRYNILLRDDKSLSYIRIDYDSNYPTVTTTRRPIDDGAKYFGPYMSTSSVRQALKLLRKIFPFATTKNTGLKRANLHYHLGLDPGLEEGKTSLKDYRTNLRKLIKYIEGGRGLLITELGKDMKSYAKEKKYEDAARARNQLNALRQLSQQVVFSDKEFQDISKDHALNELVDLLSLSNSPKRIEGYDVSHMQGTDVVASMVVFTNGVSNKTEYRKFKTKKDHNNDFYNMHETIKRRFSDQNISKWGLPDLVVIDGGKGQLGAAIQARDEMTTKPIAMIGLAKREEQIVIEKNKSHVQLNTDFLSKLNGFVTDTDVYLLLNVPHETNLIKLLQRVRDESHRFAVSYHSTLKRQRQTHSLLDDIVGVGPSTKKKLLNKFGSLRGVAGASEAELTSLVGTKLAKTIKANLISNTQSSS